MRDKTYPNESQILALEQIASLAKKLAHDARNGKLWEGDYARTKAVIRSTLDDA